jgi:cytochrome c-type biogenesis protein CcmF
MTYLIGNYSLCAAVIVAAATLLVSLAAVRFGDSSLGRIGRAGTFVLAGLLTIASAALVVAEVTSDFRFGYVSRYTERALPLGYKLAAFWAGQEGSLLLWAWVLAVMASLYVVCHRKEAGAEQPAVVGILAFVIGFFAVLMVFAANPFALNAVLPEDGRGLNPMLQDPGMIAHPPILFVGYAGFTIPFALVLGSLYVGRTDSRWIELARPWAVVSWSFLGAGIILGAEWAYTELGWGGYWAWDPVENASLLPWLTGTAMLHSFFAAKQRGMFKRWTAGLTVLTFVLCVFGTYITRSGVVDSVHTFGKSRVGDICLGFLIITSLASVVAVLWRWNALKPEHKVEGLFSREGVMVVANMLLLAMTALTLLGTMFPAISRWFTGESMSVKQGFYNRTVLPLALVLFALMAVGPLMTYGRQVVEKFNRKAWPAGALALVSIGLLLALRVTSVWALLTGAAGGAVLGAVISDIVGSIVGRAKDAGEGFVVTALKTLVTNHRRYGAHLAHVGIMMLAVGVAGSSLYGTKELVQVKPGETKQVGAYSLKLNSLQGGGGANFESVDAAVTLTDRKGERHELLPQYRQYNKAEQGNSDVGIRSSWREDVYITLAGWENDGSLATLQVMVTPLVRWIWAGGIVMVIGAVVCVLPRPSHRPAAVEKPVDTAAAVLVERRRKDKRRPHRVAAAH